MLTFATISLLSFAIVLIVGTYVYVRNTGYSVNRHFLAFSAFSAFLCFTEHEFITSLTQGEAILWLKLHLATWPVVLVTLLHLVNSFFQKRTKIYTRRAIVLDIILIVTVVYTYKHNVFLDIENINGYWKRYPAQASDLAEFIYAFFLASLTLATTYFTIKYFISLKPTKNRSASNLIIFGILSPTWLPFFTNGIFPIFNIILFVPDSLALSAGWIFFAIATWGYKIFDITPSFAAQNIISNMKEALLLVDAKGIVKYANRAFFELFKLDEALVVDQMVDHFARSINIDPDTIKKKYSRKEISHEKHEINLPNNHNIFVDFSSSFLKDKKGNIIGHVCVFNDITAMMKSEQQLKAFQQQLLQLSHQAGMSKIATNILHNIGNILNSITVSSEHLEILITNSRLSGLLNANKLLEEKKDKLVDFLIHDTQGQMTAQYYLKLGPLLKNEQEEIRKESELLVQKIKLVKDAIDLQQDIAGSKEFNVSISLIQLIEEMLKLEKQELIKHQVKILKKYQIDEEVNLMTNKSKLMNVILNILKNAYESVLDNPPDDRQIEIQVTKKNSDKVEITMRDNGKGISKENLNKIFNYGFTTKEEGHGFGLHYCANTLREMNASIKVISEGIGKGASFIIDIPLDSEQQTHVNHKV